MRKVVLAIAGFALAMGLNGCMSPSKVDAGEEGVLIKKPWFFGHGGVVAEPVQTGLVWTMVTTEVVRIDVKPFNIDETFNDLVTFDNNPVDFKIHLTFKHIKGKTPVLVENFGKNWYANKLREPLRNATRSFTMQHKMFEMTTNSKVRDNLERIVTEEIRAFLTKEGIPTELVLATVGRVMPPKAIVEATIATGVQKQNVKTQNERVNAERSRENAEKASASADKAYMAELGLTSAEYLEMKRLDNQKLAIQAAAEGKVNLNMIMGNAQPMFNIGK